jgi:tetratricopeptide (TPR) repeat protein
MQAGKIFYCDGKVAEGLSKLRDAVKVEDALRYSEPPGWILPARHSLGATLMQERRFAEAEQVYRDDLARLPENGWALFGLAQSLHREGKEEEAAATDARFRKIWPKADVQITSSCLCQPGM